MVREVAVRTDRLFASAKGDREQVKFCIKDAIYNQHVLMPLLQKMSEVPSHPLPYLKPLARENLGAQFLSFCFVEWSSEPFVTNILFRQKKNKKL